MPLIKVLSLNLKEIIFIFLKTFLEFCTNKYSLSISGIISLREFKSTLFSLSLFLHDRKKKKNKIIEIVNLLKTLH